MFEGTPDVMLHGSLWDPEEDVEENVNAYVNEVNNFEEEEKAVTDES